MKPLVASDPAAIALVEALIGDKLDNDLIVSVTLRVAVDQPVTITIESLVSEDVVHDVLYTFAEERLVAVGVVE